VVLAVWDRLIFGLVPELFTAHGIVDLGIGIELKLGAILASVEFVLMPRVGLLADDCLSVAEDALLDSLAGSSVETRMIS
jgi:hypothetical protein